MIVDLGCMKTVAGASWVNQLVPQLQANGKFLKVVPESEAFRFGDGHLSNSKYAIVMELTIAGKPILLRVSVVPGNCPPLLSKPVCSALGFVINTDNHTLSSKKLGVKAYGLEQSHGGHYILRIDEWNAFSRSYEIPSDFFLPLHKEVFVLPLFLGSSSDLRSWLSESHGGTSSATIQGPGGRDLRSHSDRMGKRGRRRRGRDGRDFSSGGSRSSSARSTSPQAAFEVSEEGLQQRQASTCPRAKQIARAGDAITTSTGVGQLGSTHDFGSDAGHDDSNERVPGVHDGSEQGTGISSFRKEQGRGPRPEPKVKERQGEQDTFTTETCGIDRGRSTFPVPVNEVFQRSNNEPSLQPQVAEPGVQMETFVAADEDQGSGHSGKPPLEAKLPLDHVDAREAHRLTLGTSGSGQTTVLQPKGVLAGGMSSSSVTTSTMVHPGSDGHPDHSELPVHPELPELSELPESQARYQDRLDLIVDTNDMIDALPGIDEEVDQDWAEFGVGVTSALRKDIMTDDTTSSASSTARKTLNRRQRRSLQQGVDRGLRLHDRIFQVLQTKPDTGATWTLLEVFAGKARLSSVAASRANWNVLPPQDLLYGLDLLNEEHQAIFKDVVREQRPDVITVSPPCGPWSSWQRMRKRKAVLRKLRQQHLPFWNLVAWLWDFQNSIGGLVILEQPAASEALRLPVMSRRKRVYKKVVHLCRLGLRDRVSRRPHKKPTVVQVNHSAIETELFPERTCCCEAGSHQPIEGSVKVRDDEGRLRSLKRSTLAAEWTRDFCMWLINGLEGLWQGQEVQVAWTEQVPSNQIWETVPVELEDSPEGQLRQQLELADGQRRYDYISFAGTSAMQPRRLRSTLAHLHVALGHISNEKFQRMLHQQGAKPHVLATIKDLQCQICRKVVPPAISPKAAFLKPSSFNVRVCSDTFYIWDASGKRFAVTHLLDAFSLYQVANCNVEATAETTCELLREKWFGVFGPPSTLMTDQGSEFQAQVEYLLRTFAVFHDLVPPTAHWRNSLAERHGAVLKILIMKIIQEQTVIGLEEMRTATTSAVCSRNMQARVSGFSPVQLVFGRDLSCPSNLMDMIAGHLQFTYSPPAGTEEAFRRAASIRKAAQDAYVWMEANETLRRAAGSRSRIPKLELLTEGSQVMFWQPPPSRRGQARRVQDNISWLGPAVVVSLERVDGTIKRVWLRYRQKLKGLPLEFVRLANVEEQEATNYTREALSELAQQLKDGRVNFETVPQVDLDQVPDLKPPMVEFSDEEFPTPLPPDDGLRTAGSVLDDVPMSVAQGIQSSKRQKTMPSPISKGEKISSTSARATVASSSTSDPALLPFRQKRDRYEEALRSTKEHLSKMRQKLQPPPTLLIHGTLRQRHLLELR